MQLWDAPLNYLINGSAAPSASVPAWGAFTFEYKKKHIHVPAFLNSVARYKPDSFWDWLIQKDPYYSYIEMTLQHVSDEEQASKHNSVKTIIDNGSASTTS